jgi:hypothetical protein
VALEAYRATTGIGGTTICSHATSPAELLAIIKRPLPSSPEPPSPQPAARLPSSVALGQRFAFGQLSTCLHREGRGQQPADLVADLPSQASALMNSPGGGALYWGLQQTQQGLVVAGMEPPSDRTMAQAAYALGCLWRPVEAERDYVKTYHRVERPTGELSPGPLAVVAFTFRPRPGLTCLACPLFLDRRDRSHNFDAWVRQLEEEDDDEEVNEAPRVQIKTEVKEEVKQEDERHEQVKDEWPLAQDIAALLREKPDKSWITQEIRRALHQRRVSCSKLDINRTLHKSGVFISHKDGADTVWRLK